MIDLLDTLTTVAIWVGAVAFTLFSPLYAWWAWGLWWRAPAGVALMVSSTATALLLDLTLVFQTWPPSLLVGAWVTLIVVGLIALGGCLKLAALSLEMRRSDHHAVPPTRERV